MAPFGTVTFRLLGHHGTNRIELDIPVCGKQVAIRVGQAGSEAFFPQRSATSMATVESGDIGLTELAHGQRHLSRFVLTSRCTWLPISDPADTFVMGVKKAKMTKWGLSAPYRSVRMPSRRDLLKLGALAAVTTALPASVLATCCCPGHGACCARGPAAAHPDPWRHRLYWAVPGQLRAGTRAQGNPVQSRQASVAGMAGRGGATAWRPQHRRPERAQGPAVGRLHRQPDQPAVLGARCGQGVEGKRRPLSLHFHASRSMPTAASRASRRTPRWRATRARTRWPKHRKPCLPTSRTCTAR